MTAPVFEMRRANRLASGGLIREVYASGRRATASSAGCVGVVTGTGNPQVAVVAGRKVGGAVARNRAKRRIRAAVDPLIARMTPGARVVVGATSQTNEAGFDALRTDLEATLQKIGALSNA